MNKKNEKFWRIVFVLFLLGLFGAFFLWSMMQPFGAPPDEKERFKIVEFIVKHGKLPHGGDPEILLYGWGFSYGFQPILSYIFSAGIVKVVSLFSDSEYIIEVAGRFFNVLLGVMMAAVVWKLSSRLFKERSTSLLFTFLVCLLPQCMFMHTYVNVDSLALLSSGIIVYAWIEGLETKWNRRSCWILGIGMGLCAMSYYDAYGFLLCSIPVFVQSFVHKKTDGKGIEIEWKGMIRKGLLAGGIAFVIAGWWFIRSAILYDGDFLGLRTRDEYAEMYAFKWLKPSSAPTWHNAGFSMWDMMTQTTYFLLLARSFVGMFEHMSLVLLPWMYPVYYAIFIIGFVGAVIALVQRGIRKKKASVGNVQKIESVEPGTDSAVERLERSDIAKTSQGEQNQAAEKTRANGCAMTDGILAMKIDRQSSIIFHICMVACIIIPNILCLWASYDVDYQPQGRYILPMIIPFMYVVAYGIRCLVSAAFRKDERFGNAIIFCAAIFVLVLALVVYKKIVFTKYYFNFINLIKSDWRTFFHF